MATFKNFKRQDFVALMEQGNYEVTIAEEHRRIITEKIEGTFKASESNPSLNRFTHNVCFDHSRVVLPTEQDRTNYINANYVGGVSCDKDYVCAEAPKHNTCYNFYRMLSMESVQVIVMLCRKTEDGWEKCAPYWSETEHTSMSIGRYQVTTTRVERFPHYVKTTLLLANGNDTRQVLTHFNFLSWPDHGVPSDIQEFVIFVQEVKRCREDLYEQLLLDGYMLSHPPPIVVHCNAGLGRTPKSFPNSEGGPQPPPSSNRSATRVKRRVHQQHRAEAHREVQGGQYSSEREGRKIASLTKGDALRSKMFAGVKTPTGALGHVGTVSVIHPVALPVTTRRIGFSTAQLCRTLASFTGYEAPTVYQLYRAFLGLFEAKLCSIQSSFPSAGPLHPVYRTFEMSLEFRDAARLATCVPEPFYTLFNSVGIFKANDKTYLPVMAKDTIVAGKLYPKVHSVLLSNLRATVTALADRTVPAAVRQEFRDHNAIPGCRFIGRILDNPDDIMPVLDYSFDYDIFIKLTCLSMVVVVPSCQ